MSEGIADGLGLNQANIHLETLHLVRKPAVTETHTARPKRGGGPSTSQRYQPYPQQWPYHQIRVIVTTLELVAMVISADFRMCVCIVQVQIRDISVAHKTITTIRLVQLHLKPKE